MIKWKKKKKNNSLSHVLEVVVQGLLREDALAQLQLRRRVVVDVVDAHLVAYREAAEGGRVVAAGVVVAGGQEGVTLWEKK